jgi:opacity protein-like surface antigen
VRQVGGKAVLAIIMALVLGLPVLARAANFDLDKLNHEVGVNFAYGKNTHGANVQLYSLLPHWGFFFVKPGQRMGPFGLSFLAEGILSIASAEQTGSEVGITPMLKLSCLVFPGVLAHIEGGAGLILQSIDSPALAHVFNFTPQIGGGVDIAITPQMAFAVAYRFRHASNAGISEPNPAFNVNFFSAGINYYY